MKLNRYAVLLLIILIGITCLTGCAGKAGNIQFENDLLEIGEVDDGTVTEGSFTFTNTGEGPLVLTDVKSTCNCTTVQSWDKTVAPGASGKIAVTFNSTGYRGDIVRLIDVITNVPEKPLVQLTLKAKVRTPLVEVAPTKLWLAEVSPELKQLYGTFTLTCNLDTSFKIGKIIPPEGIKSTHTLTTLVEGKSYKVDFVIYAPFSGSGRVEHDFILKTNLVEKPEITFPFFYYKQP